MSLYGVSSIEIYFIKLFSSFVAYMLLLLKENKDYYYYYYYYYKPSKKYSFFWHIWIRIRIQINSTACHYPRMFIFILIFKEEACTEIFSFNKPSKNRYSSSEPVPLIFNQARPQFKRKHGMPGHKTSRVSYIQW